MLYALSSAVMMMVIAGCHASAGVG